MTRADEIRRAYDEAGDSWASGPDRVYGLLAQPLLDLVGDVTGAVVLDVGTGSGVVADALVRRGAGVVGVDLSLGMLRRDAGRRPPAAVADVRALPVRSGALDLVTAAFVLNHLEDPVPAVRELHRVLRPGGVLLASTFEGEAAHPAKAAVEQVVRSFGYQPPAWYVQVKEHAMPVLAAADAFARAAREGGLEHVEVTRVEVGLALAPAELVAWRLGMAHTAAFVATLPAAARDELRQQAEELVGRVEEPVELAVLVLRASAA